MSDDKVVELQVFVESGCQQCKRALTLASEVGGDFPQLAVRIVDIAETPERRDDVFAVPTFVLNNHVLSLGNPQRAKLRQEIESTLRQQGLVE